MKKFLLLIFIICCSFTYPDNFTKMMKYILKFEGGFTMIDPGGTNYGIMQVNYNSYRASHSMKKQSVLFISTSEVYELYYYDYYLKSGSDTLNICLSFVNFDTAINCGIGQAAKFIKKVLMLPDRENAVKYITLRDQLYSWLAIHKNKQRFLKGWLNRTKEIKLILKTI